MATQLLDLAMGAARAAGALLRERFVLPRSGVETKSSTTDVVTDADRAAEQLILEHIRAVRPNDAILGEEAGEAAGTTGLRWVVDPLDGTTNYVYGIPQWAVSIACEDDTGPLVGVIYDPNRDELFSARRDGGARLNDERIRVRASNDLSSSLIATGFSYLPDERQTAARRLPSIIGHVRDVRRAGAASLDLAWVACGRYDGYYETPIAWWDVAAGTLLVTEAGGAIATLPAVGPSGGGLLASGPGIFPELHALVKAVFAAHD